MTNIRFARSADVLALVELGRRMHDESPAWSRLEYTAPRVEIALASMVAADNAMVLVAEEEDALVGGLLCVAAPHWSSNDVVASELAFFLLPTHRGRSIAARMVRRMKQWAYDQGCVLLQAGTSTGFKDEGCARFYERLGFNRAAIGVEVFYGH